MGGGDLQNFDGAEFRVHFQFGEVRAKSVDSVGDTLAIVVQRRCSGIECRLGTDNVAAFVERKLSKVDGLFLASVFDDQRAVEKVNLRAITAAGQLQDIFLQLFAGE